MPKRVDIQLAEPFSEKRLLNQGRYPLIWRPPYILQPKLNGERCRMIVSDGRCLLLSSTAEIISSVPHINHSGLSLPDGEYDGELYVHGWTWAEIHSVVSTVTTIHPKASEMQLHLFDHMNGGTQIERSISLTHLFKGSKSLGHIHLVDPNICFNLEQVYECYSAYIANGYEGFIIRHVDSLYTNHRTGAMMKFKPKCTDEYQILNVYEAISASGTGKKMLGGFTCIDDMGTEFNVGAGHLSHKERMEIWWQWLDAPEEIHGKFLRVEYQVLSDKAKVPLFSRAVRII